MPKNLNPIEVGLAVVYGRTDGSFTVGQVKFKDLSPSGIWDSQDFPNESLDASIMNHVVTGNIKGEKALKSSTGLAFDFKDLIKLASIAQESYELLERNLHKYLEANPKKSKSIAPLPILKWPREINLDEPSESLKTIGKSHGAADTQKDMVEPIASLRLASHLLKNWQVCEDQRVSRKYLEQSVNPPLAYPANWN